VLIVVDAGWMLIGISPQPVLPNVCILQQSTTLWQRTNASQRLSAIDCFQSYLPSVNCCLLLLSLPLLLWIVVVIAVVAVDCCLLWWPFYCYIVVVVVVWSFAASKNKKSRRVHVDLVVTMQVAFRPPKFPVGPTYIPPQ